MSTRPGRPVAAAIDIGSNSIKMTIAQPGEDGGIEELDWASEVVRLGQGLGETGRLDERRIEKALATLGRFAARAREWGAEQVVAVATEATRAAANGPAFLERARREAGVDVQIVTGLEEADLTFRGIAATADTSGQLVVADIGGGSTELIVARDGAVQGVRSLRLGSGQLTERFVHADPPSMDEMAACEAGAIRAITPVAAALQIPCGSGVRLIIVGGTGEYMVRLVPDEAAIDRRAVRMALGKLAVLSAAELADAIDIPEARARVLPAGVAIVAAIADLVQPDRIEVARGGIRAGLLAGVFGGWAGRAHHASSSRAEAPVKVQSRPEVEEASPGHDDFRAAMNALVAERWADVMAAIPMAMAGSSEGVHDVRVASRRLRAAMDVAAPIFPGKWFTRLHRAAQNITGALGDVRDRDVLLEALRAERAAAPLAEHPGIDRLIQRVERERAQAQVEMEGYLRGLVSDEFFASVERRFGPMPGRPPGGAGLEGTPR